MSTQANTCDTPSPRRESVATPTAVGIHSHVRKQECVRERSRSELQTLHSPHSASSQSPKARGSLEELAVDGNSSPKSVSDARLLYRKWRKGGSQKGARVSLLEVSIFDSVEFPPSSPKSSRAVSPPMSMSTTTPGRPDDTSRSNEGDRVGSPLSVDSFECLPRIPEKSDLDLEARTIALSNMFVAQDEFNGRGGNSGAASSSAKALGGSFGTHFESRLYASHAGPNNAAYMKKSRSHQGLSDLEKINSPSFFPNQNPKASVVQRGLKGSVMHDMCTAVAKQMVGDVYVPSSSGTKLVLNHLYGPVLENVQNHFKRLPARYALSVDPDDVPMHIRLLANQHRNPDDINLHAHYLKEDDGSINTTICEVVLVAKDQDSLLDAITRGLSSLRGSIMDADVMTTRDGVTLDRFVVKGGTFVPEDRLKELKRRILENLARSSDAAKVPAELTTAVNQDIESFLSLDEKLGSVHPQAQQQVRQNSTSSSPSSIQPQQPHASSERDDTNESKASDATSGSSPLPSSVPAAANDAFPSSSSSPGPLRASSSPRTRAASSLAGLEEEKATAIKPEWHLSFSELQLGEAIGTGRSGQTFSGIWRGTFIAAKVINVSHHQQSLSDELLSEFYREVAVVSRLRHPNIVLFLGVAIAPPKYCLVFEYMQNGALTDMVRQRHFSIDFFRIAREIAMGMNYLHLCSIMHRDLKSGNVLLDAYGTVKISDFGLSCVLEAGHASDLTAETGTYRWMAPEVIGHEPYSVKADVYSYGVILWEMIAKDQPFKGMSPIQAAFAVARQHMRPAFPTETPECLRALVDQCWHQDPTMRPSFAQVLEMLPHVRDRMTRQEYAAMNFIAPAGGGPRMNMMNMMMHTIASSSSSVS